MFPKVFVQNSKSKANRKYKQPLQSTSNLKSKKPCGQSTINRLLNKGLPGN